MFVMGIYNEQGSPKILFLFEIIGNEVFMQINFNYQSLLKFNFGT